MLLKQDKIIRHFDRLSSLTTDVRNLYRPFVSLALLGPLQINLGDPLGSQAIRGIVESTGWKVYTSRPAGFPRMIILGLNWSLPQT